MNDNNWEKKEKRDPVKIIGQLKRLQYYWIFMFSSVLSILYFTIVLTTFNEECCIYNRRYNIYIGAVVLSVKVILSLFVTLSRCLPSKISYVYWYQKCHLKLQDSIIWCLLMRCRTTADVQSTQALLSLYGSHQVMRRPAYVLSLRCDAYTR